MKTKSPFTIWDGGEKVPAWKKKPKNQLAEKLSAKTLQEKELGINYYIPARKIDKKVKP